MIRNPDHKDMFTWRRKRTGRSTYSRRHNRDASIDNPDHSQTRDYHYERDEPDLTRIRRLESIVDVSPFKKKYRDNPGKQNSTHRTDFRNFYPTPAEQNTTTWSLTSPRSRVLPESQPPPANPLQGQINANLFDIESRNLLGFDREIDSLYRQDYTDHTNPPLKKRTTAAEPNWDTYRPDKPRKTDLNPFDLSVRGKVPSNMSTLYRDAYVDFMQRVPMRTLDD
jgi:hypothetical protein